MSGNGIPIRLVRNDKTLIQILATDITLDVQRKVGGIPMPFTGSTRIGLDLNMNNASIFINGIITDDDIIHIDDSNKKAAAKVDFSLTHDSVTTNLATVGWVNNLNAAIIAPSNTFTAMTHGIRLINAAGASFDIYFRRIAGSVANQSGFDGSSSRYWIGVYNSSASTSGTAAEIADNLTDVINNSLSSHFTAVLATSTFTNTANSVVKITQVTSGSTGNKSAPTMTSDIWPSSSPKPYHSRFSGGVSTTNKSAGDKVMDLYGTLNNSNNGGLIGNYMATMNIYNLLAMTETRDINWMSDMMYGDYIIGIQIPFNSTINAPDGAKYKAVNFFMPTGAFHSKDSKGSSKALAASTEFNPLPASLGGSDFTGIKGTIQKATFTKIGGEPIYSFTIIFAPIDWIM